MRMDILFTSVGRRVELLRQFRKAYDALGLTGQIVAVDLDPLAPALQVADVTYRVPPIGASGYIDEMVRICAKHRVSILFPLIDPEIPILAANRQAFKQVGTEVAVVPEAASAICADKWQTIRFFDSLELHTPRSYLTAQLETERPAFPLFIKPRYGSAGKGAYMVETQRELEFFCSYVPSPIIQEFLTGPEITVDVGCDLRGDILSIVCRQRLEVRSGEVSKGVTVHLPDVIEASTKIASALPAIGPITVQCMMHDGVPHFTEINARLGGGIPLAIIAGADYPRFLLARQAGLDMQLPPIGDYRKGIYLTRFDDAFYLDEDGYAEVAGRAI